MKRGLFSRVFRLLPLLLAGFMAQALYRPFSWNIKKASAISMRQLFMPLSEFMVVLTQQYAENICFLSYFSAEGFHDWGGIGYVFGISGKKASTVFHDRAFPTLFRHHTSRLPSPFPVHRYSRSHQKSPLIRMVVRIGGLPAASPQAASFQNGAAVAVLPDQPCSLRVLWAFSFSCRMISPNVLPSLK